MIEFLAEWLVTFLILATHVLEMRAPHLSFMLLKEYWFRELYLGLKVTASFDRSESYTRVIDGQVRCITPEIKPQNLQVIRHPCGVVGRASFLTTRTDYRWWFDSPLVRR